MAAPQTVESHIRRQFRVPPVPRAPVRPTHAGTARRPFAALQPSMHEPAMRALRVPHPAPANLVYARWEGAAIGARRNTLPRYMFKPTASRLPPRGAF